MEGFILIIVAVGALLAFGVGMVLLVLYVRSGRGDDYDHQELVRYGNLVQCPRCSYMNPADSAACLNCRLPFAQPRQPVPPAAAPNYPTLPPTAYQPPPAPRPTPPPRSYVPPAGATVRRAIQHEPVSTPAPQPAVSPPPADGRPADMPHAWLEGVAGLGPLERQSLVQTDTMVGRSTLCDVQVYDPKVSRRHFQIRYGNGAFFLQDQKSSRGTYINGARVMAQRLNDGDRIEVGDTTLVFHIE